MYAAHHVTCGATLLTSLFGKPLSVLFSAPALLISAYYFYTGSTLIHR